MTRTVSEVDRAELVELTRYLVAAGQPWCENSLDGPARPPEETRIAEPVAALLREWGFDVRLAGRHPTRQNVLATKVFGPGPTLMLNDHLDTYPSGPPSRWTVCAENPYQAVELDGRIYARGTSDTRANLATLLTAARRVVADPPPSGTLSVVLTVDEERNGVEGSCYLLDEHRMRPDASITVEPTAWSEDGRGGIALATAQTGHALIDIVARGTSSHIWRPDTGVNPAQFLAEALARIRRDPVGDWPISVVGLSAGQAGMAQFTPLEARVRVAAVNVGPDVSAGELLLAFQQRVSELAPAGIETKVAYVPGPTFVAGTVEVSSDHPLVTAIADAYLAVTDEAVRHYTKPAFNDTIRFRHAGIPAVTFGPGDDGWAVYDESISIDTMVTATLVLERAVRGYLSHG
ncbi:M20 family peptidase [Mycolicibacterium sp. GF69]|uniref:M20 family metallopeptidase n=1 Tax=Mycolicibacterium sp. GF69 TaxID=2267251 RepID=UPI000DCB423F|nr:M20 family metallopeptidase [Mycolicibacterium sp. GF69]RAV10640.1 M20 family peptidase [Mycolicibacterium sp. GF69]